MTDTNGVTAWRPAVQTPAAKFIELNLYVYIADSGSRGSEDYSRGRSHAYETSTPLLKVALMFSTAAMPPGTVLAPSRPKSPTGSGVRTQEASFSHALLVDLQDAPGGSRSVAYDINGGWSWGNETWASMVTDLVSALIQPDDVDGSPASGRRMELR
jgi:hypothetical protein